MVPPWIWTPLPSKIRIKIIRPSLLKNLWLLVSKLFFIFRNLTTNWIAQKENEVAEQSQESSQESSDEEEDEDEEKVKEAIKKKHERGHKTISAEAYGKYNQKGNFVPKVIAKSQEQKQRIIQRLEKAFMFSALDDKEKNIVIDAMVEKQFA